MAIYEETQTATDTATSTPAVPKPRRIKKAAGDGDATLVVPSETTTRTAKLRSMKAPGSRPAPTKSEAVLKLLRTAKGSNIEAIMQLTGWQIHSVRGYLSAVVRKKLNLNLTSEIGKDGQRRYRIDDTGKAG